MNLAEAAAAARALADRADASLARDAGDAGGRDLLAVMRVLTPVLTGNLMDHETAVTTGGGAEAVSSVGPRGVIYARFRNYGGTITRKLPPPHVLGNPQVGFFGHSVTQAGSHYIERSVAAGRGAVEDAVRMVADEFFESSGF